jgi:hypothetical protein
MHASTPYTMSLSLSRGRPDHRLLLFISLLVHHIQKPLQFLRIRPTTSWCDSDEERKQLSLSRGKAGSDRLFLLISLLVHCICWIFIFVFELKGAAGGASPYVQNFILFNNNDQRFCTTTKAGHKKKRKRKQKRTSSSLYIESIARIGQCSCFVRSWSEYNQS